MMRKRNWREEREQDWIYSKNRKRNCREGQERRLVRRGSLGCSVAQKGSAWLSRVRRGSDRLRRGSDSRASSCCTAGPKSKREGREKDLEIRMEKGLERRTGKRDKREGKD